jgi:hypothetical protein
LADFHANFFFIFWIAFLNLTLNRLQAAYKEANKSKNMQTEAKASKPTQT